MAHLHYYAKCTVSKIQRLQIQKYKDLQMLPPWEKCTKLCLYHHIHITLIFLTHFLIYSRQDL